MIVLVVSASTIIMVPPNTEATILSDYCEEYEFLCDEETPPPDQKKNHRQQEEEVQQTLERCF